MKLLCTLILAALCVTASAQTIKTLGFNTTNGQVVANTGTNVLTFTNEAVRFASGDLSISGQNISGTGVSFSFEDADFAYGKTLVRENLGFSTNLNTLWTATNASNARSAVGLSLPALTNTNSENFRSAIGLGTLSSVVFNSLSLAGALTATNGVNFSGGASILGGGSLNVRSPGNILAASFSSTNGQIFGNLTVLGSMSVTNSAETRTNLGLGGGITTNRTFVSYNGTNYTTNSVTISNGIITGWTQ